jgi:hypothetical protein
MGEIRTSEVKKIQGVGDEMVPWGTPRKKLFRCHQN